MVKSEDFKVKQMVFAKWIFFLNKRGFKNKQKKPALTNCVLEAMKELKRIWQQNSLNGYTLGNLVCTFKAAAVVIMAYRECWLVLDSTLSVKNSELQN